MPNVTLLVEGRGDERIVTWLLHAARLPKERVEIVIVGGRKRLAPVLRNLAPANENHYAVLVDASDTDILHAIDHAVIEMAGHRRVTVFVANPEVDAWVFADENAALAEISSEEFREAFKQLPPPEFLRQPRRMGQKYFGDRLNWSFLARIDIERATARSPSLRNFIVGMGQLLGTEVAHIADSAGRSLDRDLIGALLRELPGDTTVWRTMSGSYSAEQLQHEVLSGSELGRQYSGELLRVARDFLARKAKK